MAFGRFEVHAGDFKKGTDHQFYGGAFIMQGKRSSVREKIRISKVQNLEVSTEESVKRLGGTAGWGVAGAALLGPVGLLAGLLAGGRGTDVTFICELKDGRRFMATAPKKVYNEIVASRF